MLAENIKTVEKNIKEACARANRSASDVTLIAVSKTKPVDMLCEVYDTGMREFGCQLLHAGLLYPDVRGLWRPGLLEGPGDSHRG